MRRRFKRERADAELDITAFMNLMIVLVPILLINMIFAHTSVLELNFPEGPAQSAEQQKQLQLQVIILPQRLLVADNRNGLIKEIKLADAANRIDAGEQEAKSEATGGQKAGLHDFAQLSKVMQELKARLPEKQDITIMARPDTSYQTLVSAMDTVRSFATVVAGSVVQAELFPEISIADVPESLLSSEQTQANLADIVAETFTQKVES